jgi:hypothetical protein
VYPGTPVIRDRSRLTYKRLNDKGLTFYQSFDKWRGRNASNHGIKGWCANSHIHCFIDPFRTADYRRGTVCFWFKRDPAKRNENQYTPNPAKTWRLPYGNGYGPGETLTGGVGVSYISYENCNFVLRRFPGWGGKDGYLELVYCCIENKRRYVQVPYKNDWLWQWHHVAALWDIEAKRLEIYIDGKLAGRAEPGDEPWLGRPWDCGQPNVSTDGGFSLGSCDHGKVALTLRDEFYLYNRALGPEEIKANMEKAKKAKVAEAKVKVKEKK